MKDDDKPRFSDDGKTIILSQSVTKDFFGFNAPNSPEMEKLLQDWRDLAYGPAKDVPQEHRKYAIIDDGETKRLVEFWPVGIEFPEMTAHDDDATMDMNITFKYADAVLIPELKWYHRLWRWLKGY